MSLTSEGRASKRRDCRARTNADAKLWTIARFENEVRLEIPIALTRNVHRGLCLPSRLNHESGK
jgi:hypothetical protein